MSASDRLLSLDRAITRRDLVHDVSLAGLGLALPLARLALPAGDAAGYYPPILTGLRGSHAGAFEAAHALAREGQRFDNPLASDETYDLVVVGGGISGLAAAYYYRKLHGPESRILILDNDDDFGGHAKRNELHQGRYGRDMLLRGVTRDGLEPRELATQVDAFPISTDVRAKLKAFLLADRDVLVGKSDDERMALLHGTRYTDFLREQFGLPDAAIQIFSEADGQHPGGAQRVRQQRAAGALHHRDAGGGEAGPLGLPHAIGLPGGPEA